jgi:hypothetical protein
MHSTNCKNCDAPLNGKFCSNCGQTVDIHRVTFGHFLHDFFHAFTHADKGILLLMKELIRKPGLVAKEYLEGKRKKYFNPLSFLVILSSIYAYASHTSGYFEALTHFEQQQIRPNRMPYYAESMEFMLNNGKFLALILMPLLMSFFSWLFFRKEKYNFAENLVLNAFVMGQIYIVMVVIFIPCFVLFPGFPVQLNNNIFHLLMIAYMIVAYQQFFGNKVIFTVLKSISITLLFMTFFWLSIWGYVVIKHVIFE